MKEQLLALLYDLDTHGNTMVDDTLRDLIELLIKREEERDEH